MLATAIKIAVTAVLVVAISEVAKRSSLLGAVLASIPLTSVLAMVWLYADTGDAEKVAELATGIFWLVLPSLVLFIALPLLLRAGWDFAPSLLAAGALTVACYFLMLADPETLRHRDLTGAPGDRAGVSGYVLAPCCTSTISATASRGGRSSKGRRRAFRPATRSASSAATAPARRRF